MSEPIYFSYTRSDRDERCNRAGYYYSVFGQRGIVPATPAWDLTFGNLLHTALEEVAKTGSSDPLALRAKTLEQALLIMASITHARAWAALAEGLLRGFLHAVWPRLMAEYTVFQTEQDGCWEVEPGQFFLFRQDLLLRNKFTDAIVYYEWKTTGLNTPEWIASWARSVQLYSSLYAVRQLWGTDIAQAVVLGLYKGYKERKSGGIQRSVFNSGYVNREYALLPEYAYDYRRGRGWESFSTFEEFSDLSQWVGQMPAEVLIQQFPQTAPLFPRDDVARRYFAQQLIRNREMADAKARLLKSTSVTEIQDILDRHFKQDFSRCQPAYGTACEYLACCWEPAVEADPLGSRLYVERAPHHPAELKA